MLDEETFTLSNQKLLPVIEGSVEDIRETIKKYNAKVIVNCANEIYADIDSQLFREAIINLIENAIKYSDVNPEVILNIKENTENIYIDVKNTGSVIPEKERNKIFNRFYRIDKSRSKKTGGTGLGLAIVKHISIVHNGNIWVNKSDKKST